VDDARAILDAIVFLQSRGHDVGLTGDVPLVWHIDGRPVITRELLDVAAQEALK